MRVFVYYNIHKRTWSIKALEGLSTGLVVAHSDHVLLQCAESRVSEKGRQRVIREQCKNVHAGIVGELIHTNETSDFTGLAVTYNPYKYKTFVYTDTQEPYHGSAYAYLHNRQVTIK